VRFPDQQNNIRKILSEKLVKLQQFFIQS